MIPTIVRYGVPVALLGGVVVSFLLSRRHTPLPRGTRLALTCIAAAPLLVSGTLHLLRPGAFLPLLPPWAPHPRLLIVLTGVPELAGAAGLFLLRFRRAASLWLSIFMVAIFPANVYVAGQTVGGLPMPGVPVRAAMQAGYIVLLLVVGYGLPRRAAEASSSKLLKRGH